MRSKPTSTEGRFAYEGLDRVIHERARLSVLTSLMTNPKGVSFNDLKQLCALTDGDLSRHLSVLEEAKMVEIIRGHDRNRPLTIRRITTSVANGTRCISRHLSRWYAMRLAWKKSEGTAANIYLVSLAHSTGNLVST